MLCTSVQFVPLASAFFLNLKQNPKHSILKFGAKWIYYLSLTSENRHKQNYMPRYFCYHYQSGYGELNSNHEKTEDFLFVLN